MVPSQDFFGLIEGQILWLPFFIQRPESMPKM